ncbi:MAG: hypothetical protein ACO295_00440 [Sediminibacterium sp.]
MPQITPPETGQPLDLNYINQIATSLNELTKTVESRSTTASSINNVAKLNNNLRFYGNTLNIQTDASAGGTSNFTFNFGEKGFDGVPVCTVSIIQNASSPLADVYLKNVTSTAVSGTVVYRTRGAVNITVSLLAIGIAPSS